VLALSFELVSADPVSGCPPLVQPIFELRRSERDTQIQQLTSQNATGSYQNPHDHWQQLSAVQAELAQSRQQSWQSANDLAMRTAERDSLALQLRAAQDECAAVHLQLADAVAAHSRLRENPAIAADAERLAIAEAQQRELQQSLAEARAQISQLAIAALELATARAQLAELREELHKLQLQGAGGGDHESVSDYQRQICELELERRSLRAELDAVRRLAQELADHLSETRRHVVEERAEWNAELRHLRRLLERQSQMVEDRNSFAFRSSNGRGSPNIDPLESSHDPLMGNLIDRFAPVQHERTTRNPKLPAKPPAETNEG
jgi:chromosome segregation ATPase